MTRLEPNNSLYIITGWFWGSRTESTSERDLFGGHFDLNHDDTIEGRLSDDCGTSRIIGTMTPEMLEFVKTYRKKEHQKKPTTWYYKFEKKNGIWIGGYDCEKIETTYLDYNTIMQARCLTLPVLDAYKAMNKRRLDNK
jgi:hypothetical protein